MSWNQNIVKMVQLCSSENMQWCRGEMCSSLRINVVNIYGPHEISDKKLFWHELSNLVRRFQNEPVCLMGDFNCVRNDEDRIGCEYSHQTSSILNEFIEDLNLIEIKDAEVSFTWFGPKNKKKQT